MGGDSKGKDETWADDTPSMEILEEIICYMKHKEEADQEDVKQLEEWNEILHSNLYDTLEHIKDIEADEWSAMKLPMRLRTIGRKMIWGTSKQDLTIPHSSKKRSKKSKHSVSSVKDSEQSKNKGRNTNLIDFKKFQDRKAKRTSFHEVVHGNLNSSERYDESPPPETNKSTSFNPKVFRIKTDDDPKDKDKDKDDLRKKLTRSTSVKLKAWRDLTRSDARKEDSTSDNRYYGMAVVGGLNEVVDQLFNAIRETGAIPGDPEKQNKVSLKKKNKKITKNHTK